MGVSDSVVSKWHNKLYSVYIPIKCCTGMTVSTEELVTTTQKSVPVIHIW